MTDLEILMKQEDELQFDFFDQEEAYKLGTFMVSYAHKYNVTIAISIRMSNGYTAFQYGPEGTCLNNQRWMDRKYNTICNWQKSSLHAARMLEERKQSLEHHGVSSADYALCGGGFPVRIKGNSGIIGFILVSNLFHVADHAFIIDCLKEYLQKPDVPVIEYEYKN